MVHFLITPRDEWWWHEGAWDETAGQYRVQVGDSSAQADLTLSARYLMAQGIGNRRVTVTAPSIFKPGASVSVTVSLSPGGHETLNGIRLALRAPAGWRVKPLGPSVRGHLLPSDTMTAKFAVSPPSDAVTQNVTIYGTAYLSHGACLGKEHEGYPEKEATRHGHASNGSADNLGVSPNTRGCRELQRHGGVTVRLAS